MPLHNLKPKKKAVKQPRNTRDTANSGLNDFIIRTRRQSKQQDIQMQTKMASSQGEISQPEHSISAINSMSIDQLHEINEQTSSQHLLCDESGDKNESSFSSQTMLKTPYLNKDANYHSDNAVDSAHGTGAPLTAISTRGMVAEMVDKLNHTPNNSPVTSPHSKATHLPVDLAHLMANKTTLAEADLESMPLNTVIQDLLATTKVLNGSVTKLQQELANLRQEKLLQDNKVSSLIDVQKSDDEKLQRALKQLEEHDRRFHALLGVITKQDQEILALKKVLNNMSVRASKNNLVITGIIEDRDENPKWKVLEFFKDKLQIQDNIVLQNAYRVGAGTDRPMVVELQKSQDKTKIYQKVGNLKGVKNTKKKPYFVSDQLPEDLAEKKRQENVVKSYNNKLPIANQLDMAFKKGELQVQGKRYEPPIAPPTPRQLVLPSEQEKAINQQVEIFEGATRDKNSSYFIGYAARVKKIEQVEGAYRAVRREHPDATHVMCAFRFPGTNPTKSFGLADDGENGGARRILNKINQEDIFNIAVFVVRYYGGVNLGPDRFAFIETVALSAISELLDSQRPQSTPWNDQPPSSSWDDELNSASKFDPNTSGLPNEGRANPRIDLGINDADAAMASSSEGIHP